MTGDKIIIHPAVECSLLCQARRLALATVALEVAQHSRAHVCEFGAYKGGSYAILRQAMPRHEIHVYDSWTGLPAPTKEDGDNALPTGKMKATVEEFGLNTATLLPKPLGLFHGPIDHRSTMPHKISLAFLDLSRYLATAHVLLMIHHQNRMADGGVIVANDYSDRFPGVKLAVDKYLAKNTYAKTEIVKGEPDDMIIIRL